MNITIQNSYSRGVCLNSTTSGILAYDPYIDTSNTKREIQPVNILCSNTYAATRIVSSSLRTNMSSISPAILQYIEQHNYEYDPTTEGFNTQIASTKLTSISTDLMSNDDFIWLNTNPGIPFTLLRFSDNVVDVGPIVINQMKIDNHYVFPLYINQPNTVIELAESITLNSVDQFFVIGASDITFNGKGFSIYIDNVVDYPGLIRNGRRFISESFESITVKNLSVIAKNNSTLAEEGGWVGQSNFGYSLNNIHFINVSANGNLINRNSGGICGSRSSANFSRCFFTGIMFERGNGAMIGDKPGYYGGTILVEGCYANGKGVVQYMNGGLLGGNYEYGGTFNQYPTDTFITIRNCYTRAGQYAAGPYMSADETLLSLNPVIEHVYLAYDLTLWNDDFSDVNLVDVYPKSATTLSLATWIDPDSRSSYPIAKTIPYIANVFPFLDSISDQNKIYSSDFEQVYSNRGPIKTQAIAARHGQGGVYSVLSVNGSSSFLTGGRSGGPQWSVDQTTGSIVMNDVKIGTSGGFGGGFFAKTFIILVMYRFPAPDVKYVIQEFTVEIVLNLNVVQYASYSVIEIKRTQENNDISRIKFSVDPLTGGLLIFQTIRTYDNNTGSDYTDNDILMSIEEFQNVYGLSIQTVGDGRGGSDGKALRIYKV